MTIAQIVKDAREKASLTQTKLAEEADISLSFLSCIESGKRTPTKQVARKLAKVLGIPEQDLLKHCNKEKVAIGEGKITYIPLQCLPIVEKLKKVPTDQLPQVDQAISEILEQNR